jgi:hypothetical protein
MVTKSSPKIVATKSYEIGLTHGKSVRAELSEDIGVVTLTVFDASYRPETVTEISGDDTIDFAELLIAVGEEIAATKQKDKNNG